MIAYKLHYHQLTADHLTSCNALRSLFQLQQEGPDLLAGEAQFGAQGGGGQGAHADVGRHQSFFWKKGHWLMMHQSWNCTWHSLTMLNTFNWQVTPFWNTQTRLQKLYTLHSQLRMFEEHHQYKRNNKESTGQWKCQSSAQLYRLLQFCGPGWSLIKFPLHFWRF